MEHLLETIHKVGASEQVTVLADRAAAYAALTSQDRVKDLLRALREICPHGPQADVLIDRLPGAGMLELFLQQEGIRQRFWFRREPDGSPSAEWGWGDMD